MSNKTKEMLLQKFVTHLFTNRRYKNEVFLRGSSDDLEPTSKFFDLCREVQAFEAYLSDWERQEKEFKAEWQKQADEWERLNPS